MDTDMVPWIQCLLSNLSTTCFLIPQLVSKLNLIVCLTSPARRLTLPARWVSLYWSGQKWCCLGHSSFLGTWFSYNLDRLYLLLLLKYRFSTSRYCKELVALIGATKPLQKISKQYDDFKKLIGNQTSNNGKPCGNHDENVAFSLLLLNY